MPSIEELRQKLADARQEVRNLSVMAMKPDLSPQKKEVIHHLERSARAGVTLRHKALDYELSREKR
jgi:hypothetical protein